MLKNRGFRKPLVGSHSLYVGVFKKRMAISFGDSNPVDLFPHSLLLKESLGKLP